MTPARLIIAMFLTFVLSAAGVMGDDRLVTLTRKSTAADSAQSPEQLTGRIVTTAADGSVLLETRAGVLHQLRPETFSIDAVDSDRPFTKFDTDELSAELLRLTGDGFRIQQTQHFVLCSSASELYTSYCGRLLERVADEFERLFRDGQVKLTPLNHPLPVIIFREPVMFQEFAAKQHPDVSFTDVPGYYSVRDNQMLIAAVSGDRDFHTNSDVLRELKKRPRQVETIVHEAVHQLCFNSGLMVRYAETRLWLAEGLAVYFEPIGRGGSLVWNRPGAPSSIHLPGFKTATASGRFQVPIHDLLTSDDAFSNSETVAAAYAEAWAVTWYLLRHHRDRFDQLMKLEQQRQPLTGISADRRQQEARQITGPEAAAFEQTVIQSMSRVK
ncbi:MAG: DUF1570 domain-containing protein [Planctomycetaceae bacterium]